MNRDTGKTITMAEYELLLEEEKKKFLLIDSTQKKQIGRNDLCPCGSGKKFKRCHLTSKYGR